MILLILGIFVVLFFIVMNYSKPTRRTPLSILMFCGLALSLLAIVANFHSYFGMKEEVVKATEPIYSASPSKELPLLLYQPVGTTGAENVYIYDKEAGAQKPETTVPDIDVKNIVQTTSASDARLEVEKTEEVYTSNWMKLLFGVAGNDHAVIKTTNTFYIPASWHTLSTDQAKELQAKMQDPAYQSKLKQEGEPYIQEKVGADMAALAAKARAGDADAAAILSDPAKMQQEQSQLVDKYTKEFQAQAVENLIKEVQA